MKHWAAIAFSILAIAGVALAHADGIFNPTASNVGYNDFGNIDSNKAGNVSTLACTYTPVTTGTENVAYTGATPSASGGVPAYTFSETGSLPTGLSINTSTGVISGTPTVSGSFPGIQVKVTDTASTTVNCGASFTLVISFTGPCDISGVTCVGYFSTFGCAQNAYAGNVIDVVDASTGNTTGTRLQCASGVVSALVSASACTFVTGNACSPLATTCAVSCTFSTVYNQMGTGTISNLTLPAALANRSLITLNALNSKPCFANAATGLRVSSTSTFSLAQPMTLAAVSKRTGGTAANGRIISDSLATITLNYRSSVNTLGSQAGTITETASDNAFHGVMMVTASGAGNSFLVVDGTPSATGTLTTSFSSTNLFLLGDNAANDMIGASCESIITSNALTAIPYAALNSNFRDSDRWGNSF